MLSIWIIHRDPKARAAIARISGVGERAVLASPTDRVLDGADAPTVVVLGLSGDFEIELDFVHRHAAKLEGCDWILLASAADTEEARRLFDTLPGRVLVYPPDARALRRAIRAAVQQRHADPLSARQGRAELQARFSRWFGDLELPELMRALDPRLARVPVLIHGEEGTGRSLLARYIHLASGRPEHALVQISCHEGTTADGLLRQMSDGAPRNGALTFHLEDADRLPIALQRRLRDWIEFGPPDGLAHRHAHRFMASVACARDLDLEPGLDPRLAETLSGLTIALPPLRERAPHVASFVADTAAAIARSRGESPRRFSEDAIARLTSYPWPGNLHELEAVVTRTLSFTQANPVQPIHLRFPADLQWLDEPLGRSDLEPEAHVAAAARAAAAQRAPSTRTTTRIDVEDESIHTSSTRLHLDEAGHADASSDDAGIVRPTAFPRPSPETLRVPIEAEPIDDLEDLDPGATRGHEDDIDVGREATFGAEPVSTDALDEPLAASLRTARHADAHITDDHADTTHAGVIDERDEEDLFPEDDVEDADEAEETWLPEAELVDEQSVDDELDELFAEVELIDEPEVGASPDLREPDVAASPRAPEPGFAATQPIEEPEATATRPLDARTAFEPPAVEPTELLPDVEPLAPPVRPLPEAGDGDAIAASMAEDALPFDEPFEHRGEPREAEAEAEAESESGGAIDARLYELIGAIAHEVRNPLVSIRTFSELLPDHYDDPEFRNHFRELVVKDVQRIDRVVSRLQSLAEGQRKPEPVDVARLLDRLLDERRPVIQSRRLLVLKELDHTQPLVLADAEQIEDAISGLLDRAIEQASERGDVYLASKYNERGQAGRPSVRILIRHTRATSEADARNREATRVEVPTPDQAMLDLVLAKRLIEAQGGDLSVDEPEAGESVIVLDLPSA